MSNVEIQCKLKVVTKPYREMTAGTKAHRALAVGTKAYRAFTAGSKTYRALAAGTKTYRALCVVNKHYNGVHQTGTLNGLDTMIVLVPYDNNGRPCIR